MTCRACKRDHSPTMRCEVAARLREPAINTAINRVRLTDAINAKVDEGVALPRGGMAKLVSEIAKAPSVSPGAVQVVAGNEGVEDRSPNRRSREDYNAYMREYMKRRRAGFIGIAYG